MDPLNTSSVLSGNQIPPPDEKKSVGPVAGAVIIILLLAAGGLYFWGAKLNTLPEPVPYIPSNDTSFETPGTTQPMNIEATTGAAVGLPPQSNSDDTAAIEADLNAMDMTQLDAANSATLDNM